MEKYFSTILHSTFYILHLEGRIEIEAHVSPRALRAAFATRPAYPARRIRAAPLPLVILSKRGRSPRAPKDL